MMILNIKYQIRTTGLAGGLLTPYKGSLPALESKDSSNWSASRNIIYSLSPFGLFLFVCFYWLSRKRVYILLECHLVIFPVFLQLILDILLYLFRIFPYRIYIISSAPEMSVPKSILQICVPFKYHERTFPF